MQKPPDLPEPVGTLCPYCKQVLQKKPRAKEKCPFCGNYIHVRKGQHIFPSTLLTEDEARLIDYFQSPEAFDIQAPTLLTMGEDLVQRFAKDSGSREVLWSVLNQFVRHFVQSEDLQSLSTAYYLTARLLHAEGKDWLDELQSAARVRLLYYRRENLANKVEITTADNACEACEQLAGQVLTIDDALARMPIPCQKCTHEAHGGMMGFCRCSYAPKEQ